MKRIFRFGIALALLIGVLAGCANPGAIALNTTADELVKKLGKPTDTRPHSQGGEFWDYVYGPEGVATWRYAIDNNRTVRSADQLLTHERLYRVVPGVTTEAGVLDLLGRPRLVTRFRNEAAWEWRADLSPNTGIFIVRFSHDGLAMGVGVIMDASIDGDSSPP